MIPHAILSQIDLASGALNGVTPAQRRLSDLRGSFVDTEAFERALQAGNPLLYWVTAVDSPAGGGQLHYALGSLAPGRIGREYYLTKGHYHARREAAEVYIAFRGEGLMLLEDEQGDSRIVPLAARGIVYVPGNTAHRTINTGSEPLVYLGVYPADAGHDYSAIAKNNFRKIVIEQNGSPVLLDRADYRP